MTKEEIIKLYNELKNEPDLDITVDKIIEQIETFERGIPFIKLVRPCKIGDGIKVIAEEQHQELVRLFQSALDNKKVMKFVPASGAATRMFRKLQAVTLEKKEITIDGLKNENADEVVEFLENIHRFAFYDDLKKCFTSAGKDINESLKKNVAEILRLTLNSEGLNYSNLPKGCIKFHNYNDGARTAFEEHLVEAIHYAAGKDKTVKIHFTISQEHEHHIKKLISTNVKKYEKKGWLFDVSYSFQSPSTNTIAVTLDNKLHRDEKGNIVLRPGGHGALLKNLAELDGDIILIKNIDNVVPDYLKSETYKYKKLLGGYLIKLQNRIFDFLNELENINVDGNLFQEIEKFISFELELEIDIKSRTAREKRKSLFNLLNRPVRVCGIVKKEQHPGGGPFWVRDELGTVSKQVVEATQVDMDNPDQRTVVDDATHFSPVDFACSVRDYKGNNFDLDMFSNPNTGLITKKSKDGKELKALELPGLWNGGMYNWITVFVEVPKITFNPVKEVNDLLRSVHQPPSD